MAFGVMGQKLGLALMRNLSSIARRAGLNKLIAEVLASNAVMLKVFEKSGLDMTTKRESAVNHVTLKFVCA